MLEELEMEMIQMNKLLSFSDVEKAAKRIESFVKKTPIFTNKILDQKIGAQVFFKCENLQETKSFKARGVFNALLSYQEKNHQLPKKIVVQSSGNHGQAIAYAAKKFGLEALVYMTTIASKVKIKAIEDLGAKVVLCEKRSEVNRLAEEKIKEGYLFIHPSANNDVILGQATVAYEALNEIGEVDAVFAPVGGGGLVSGTYLAAQGYNGTNRRGGPMCPPKVFACEPKNANDVKISVRQNKIFAFAESPNTIADGARTLSTAEPCFTYLKKLNDILEISEEEIIFWQKEFLRATNILIEPTSALAVAGAAKYVKENKISADSKLLVIISGGNV